MAQLDKRVDPNVIREAPALEQSRLPSVNIDSERQNLRGRPTLAEPLLVAQAAPTTTSTSPTLTQGANNIVPTHGQLNPRVAPEIPTGRGFAGSNLRTAGRLAGAGAVASQFDGPLPFVDAAVTGATIGTVIRGLDVTGTGNTVGGLVDNAVDRIFNRENVPPPMSTEEQREYRRAVQSRDQNQGTGPSSPVPNSPVAPTSTPTTNGLSGGGILSSPAVPVQKPWTPPPLDPEILERQRRFAEQQRASELAEAKKLEQSIENFSNYRQCQSVYDAARSNPPNLGPGNYAEAVRFDSKPGETYAAAAHRTVSELSAANKATNHAALNDPAGTFRIAFGLQVDMSLNGSMSPKSATAPYQATISREELSEAVRNGVITTDDLKRNGIPVTALIKDRPPTQVGDPRQTTTPNPDNNQSERVQVGDSPDQLRPQNQSTGTRTPVGDRPGELLSGDRSNGQETEINPGNTPLVETPTGSEAFTGTDRPNVEPQHTGNQVYTGNSQERPEIDLGQQIREGRPGEAVAGIPSRPEPGWGNGFAGSAAYENKLREWEEKYGDQADDDQSSSSQSSDSRQSSSNESRNNSNSGSSGGGGLFSRIFGREESTSESSSEESTTSRSSRRNPESLGYGSSAEDYARNLTPDQLRDAAKQFGSNPTVRLPGGGSFTASKSRIEEAIQLQQQQGRNSDPWAREREVPGPNAKPFRSEARPVDTDRPSGTIDRLLRNTRTDTTVESGSQRQYIPVGNGMGVLEMSQNDLNRLRQTNEDLRRAGLGDMAMHIKDYKDLGNGRVQVLTDHRPGKTVRAGQNELTSKQVDQLDEQLDKLEARLKAKGVTLDDMYNMGNIKYETDRRGNITNVYLIDPGIARGSGAAGRQAASEDHMFQMLRARAEHNERMRGRHGNSSTPPDGTGGNNALGRTAGGSAGDRYHQETTNRALEEGARGRTPEQQRLLDQLEERRRRGRQ